MNQVQPNRPGDFHGSKSQIESLDGLRALAVLLVLATHLPVGFLGALAPRLDRLRYLGGYLGVDVFFVLSGFLITRILLADRASGAPLRLFWMRRFLRLFPIYYSTLLIVAIVRFDRSVFWCAAYLSNFYFAYHPAHDPMTHTWSLCVEEHFYLVWPLVVSSLAPRTSLRLLKYGILPATVIGAGIVVNLHDRVPAAQLIYSGSMFRALSLGFGSMLAYHEESLIGGRSAIRWCAAALFAGVTAMGLNFVVVPLDWRPLATMVAFSLISLSLLLFVLATPHSTASKMFRTRSARYVGRISYGLYLYHYPIYFAFGLADGHDETWRICAAVVLTFLVASASFAFVETPLLRLKDRMRPNTPPATKPTALAGVGSR